MCGIAGILRFDGEPVSAAEIGQLTDALAHRGRDSAQHQLGGHPQGGVPAYPGIALGHRRLSIIDLSPHAAQPMRSASGRMSIVYNGELYNYRELRRELQGSGCSFRTDSDTEVVLAAFEAWGEACLGRFDGMFAFAVWDDASQSLFCARDPIGVKPFYYIHDGVRFAFASESQALVRGRRSALDPMAVACYFLSMYVPRHLSIFSGVRKLLPGQRLRVSRDGAMETKTYWRPPTDGRQRMPLEEAARDLIDVLDRAVSAQLRSDVPVGAFLSGGFDSGMILASAARTGAPLHTYSVGFDDARHTSELPIARDMAARYGAIHHERVIAGTEIMGLLDGALDHMSEPVADSAIVPTYCLAGMAAGDGVKVLLSGTGGDEVFAGYSRYVGSSWQRRLLLSLPRALRSGLGASIFRQTDFGARLRYPALDMMIYAGGSPRLARTLVGDTGFDRLLGQLVDEVYPPPGKGPISVYEHMRFDLQVYLPDLLLLLLDQLTMAHTVEGRVPLLATDLIEKSYSFAAALHASPHRAATRGVMREMARERIDPRTFTARKMGFSGPVRAWIAGNHDAFKATIMEAREIDALRALPLERLWREGESSGDHAWSMDMFALYCFIRWCRSHGYA